jgi:hypothetical protein
LADNTRIGGSVTTFQTQGNARAPGTRAAGLIAPAAAEVAVLGVLFLIYNLGRLLARDEEVRARSHADLVHRLETWLGLPSEAALQDAVASVPHLFRFANEYYVTVHFPVMIAFLLFGFFARPRAEYLWARNLLVVMTFLALALHLSFPLAPPRMFPQWGFVDTMTDFGPSAYDGASASAANQFAAMPSLHIGWALLIAVVLVRTAPRPLAVLAVLHAAMTVFVVVITANHWWIDGIVAGALLLVALRLFPAPSAYPRVRSSQRALES